MRAVQPVLMIPSFTRSKVVLRNLNPLSANPTKWSNTLKQFVGKLPTNYLNVFVGLAFKGSSL